MYRRLICRNLFTCFCCKDMKNTCETWFLWNFLFNNGVAVYMYTKWEIMYINKISYIKFSAHFFICRLFAVFCAGLYSQQDRNSIHITCSWFVLFSPILLLSSIHHTYNAQTHTHIANKWKLLMHWMLCMKSAEISIKFECTHHR